MQTFFSILGCLFLLTACSGNDESTTPSNCRPPCESGLQCLEMSDGQSMCARTGMGADTGQSSSDGGMDRMDQGHAMAMDASGIIDTHLIPDAERMMDAELMMDVAPVPRTRAEEYYDNCMNGPHAAADPFRADACRMLNYINADRALFDAEAEGAQPVDWSPDLFLVARAHSEDMCNRRFFGHVNPGGQNPGDRVDAAGYNYLIAENIAVNKDVAAAQHAFMAEPTCTGHRGYVLTPRAVSVGIGMAQCQEPGFQWDGFLMLTQNFAWNFANGESPYCLDPVTDCELPGNPVSTATLDCPQQLRNWGWCDYDPAEIMAPRWGCPED